MSLEFRIRDYFHPWPILRLHRTLERTQWLPAAELRAYQLERLNRVVRQAREQAPYYRRLLARHGLSGKLNHAAELERLPLLSKETLRREGASMLAGNARRYAPRWHSTSGTSGAPVRFALDRGSRALEFCYYWRHWSWAGYRLGDRFAELSSLHFLAQRRDAVADWQPHLRRLVLNAGQLSAATASRVATAIRRRRPRFVKGSPSALHALVLALDDAGVEAPPFEAVFTTGEVLAPLVRRRLECAFGGPVLDSYGHMEQTVAISQCLDGGYHVHADYGLLELVDVRRAADGARLAQVVGTSLYNLSMPLLRYDVGDHIEPLEEEQLCRCGRTLPLVKAVHGRSEDTIVTPDGRFLTALFLLPALAPHVRSAQIHQESASRLTMLVVPGRGFSDAERRRLSELGGRMAGPEMRFRVVLAREQDLLRGPSGKRKVVIGLAASTLVPSRD